VGAEGPEGGGEDLIRNRVAADLARKFVRRAKSGGAEVHQKQTKFGVFSKR
jgi:hypothetical protein